MNSESGSLVFLTLHIASERQEIHESAFQKSPIERRLIPSLIWDLDQLKGRENGNRVQARTEIINQKS
jgi:hypothetical protein